MCNNCYEKFVNRVKRKMLFCKLLDNNSSNIMTQLCICQKYCSEKDEYIPFKQKEGCKKFN